MIKNSEDRTKIKKRERRWKLFHATDFQSLMYPNFTLSKILGIFPYNIKASTFETSKPRYIMWTIIICAICIYELTLIYELNLSGRIKVDVFKIISFNFTYMSGMFTAVVSYVLSGPRMRLLQTVLDISSGLPQQSYQKLSILIHAKDIFGFFFLLWLGVMCFINYDEIVMNVSLEVSRLSITLLAFQMDNLYVNCVCVLKACFKEINDKLENLRELEVNTTPTWIYHQQRYPFLLIKLKTLEKQHLMVSNTVKMLNVIFSLQLLTTIVVCFKQITFFLYFHIVEWHDEVIISLNKKIHDVIFMSYIVYYFTRITLIVWACETGKNQAVKIGTTIHDVLNSTIDEQLKYELQLFSLQTFHCQNTFTAKALTIDMTLLTAIVSGITTYLLILTQFLIMSHSCDKKIPFNTTQVI